MSRYRISIERDALRTLAKLDKSVRRRVQTAIDRLAEAAASSRPPEGASRGTAAGGAGGVGRGQRAPASEERTEPGSRPSEVDDPRPAGVRALTGRPGVLRLRVGNYRVIYQVRDAELVVLVVDLGHRSVIYRD